MILARPEGRGKGFWWDSWAWEAARPERSGHNTGNSGVMLIGAYPGRSAMRIGGERLHGTLEGYGRFLIEKDLSSQKERSYLAR